MAVTAITSHSMQAIYRLLANVNETSLVECVPMVKDRVLISFNGTVSIIWLIFFKNNSYAVIISISAS